MRRWIRLVAVDSVLVAGWLGSVGAVVLHEQGYLFHGAVNPVTSLHATLGINEQWFGLYYRGQKIGYAQTMVVPDEREGIPGVTVTDRGRLAFTLLGIPQKINLAMRAFIDADWRLQQFNAALDSDTYHLRWSGHREGGTLVIAVSSGETQSIMRVDDPGGGVLAAGLSPWAAFHRLRVGQWGSMWLLNPLAVKPERVYFHVKEQVLLDGRQALVIETDFRGLTTTSWVTPEGEVLREDSPLGWELVHEPMEQALKVAWDAPALDLLSTTAVPIDRTLAHPERVTRLICLLEGARASALTLERPWQMVLPPERLSAYGTPAPGGSWCLLELTRPALPQAPPQVPAPPERYRRPSTYVQSDDPRIRAQARAIVGALTDPWQAAVALQQWVYTSLTKRLTVGFPSAVDVLLSKSGDCHEHTVLFTALARSVGLPTRMVAGLVYSSGHLYYHAWPEVWVGAWIPTDPTLGQALADATHLALTEAEDEQLIGVGQFLGQLRVRVLEVEEEPE